jgi:hypothetical protein
MIRFFYILIFFVCTLLLSSCPGSTGGETQLPPKVIMVERSPDTAAVELGIDALPESDGIQVQWHKLYHPAVKYYHLWRKGEDDLVFRRIKVIDPERTSLGGDTTYIDTDSTLRTFKYFQYYVVAANKESQEGQPSDTVAYGLIEKAVLNSPNQNQSVTGDLIFSWEFIGYPFPQEFIVTIEEDITKKLVYANIFWNENLSSSLYSLNLSEKEPGLKLTRGTTYRWRIDCIGEDAGKSGSESEWLRFIIN